ncbi:gamma-glutamylcyclotransferase family protein [Rhodomicrobium sp. R_RK_3]|nr:gamma-glutamylcyclotransferase family protein [Rhodomicrobium sp. R_RK_3]
MHVFVYGTLRAGEVNDISAAAVKYRMAAPTLIGTAKVMGRLYDFGAYPGLVLDSEGVPVIGEVYEIDDMLIAVLDQIERDYPGDDALFGSRDVPVEVGGVDVTCRIYPVSSRAVAGMAEIASGDWVAHRRKG